MTVPIDLKNPTWTLPVLVHIQTHLDGDLSLKRLADEAHLSPYYFHRRFQALVGETVKTYTQRLRLERAAYLLKIQDATILEIALGSGYRNHETFSRAFKRHFRMTPRKYRRTHRPANLLPPSVNQQSLNRQANEYRISRTRINRIRPIQTAFLRNLGPYLDVDLSLYDRLLAWARPHGLDTKETLLLGVGHDDPNVTPANKLRFDACLQVPAPFQPRGEVGYQVIPGGDYAVTTYTGPFGPTLEAAYAQIFVQIRQIKDIEIIGLPVIEIYQTTKINPDYELNHTDILIPVLRKGPMGLTNHKDVS